MSKKIVSFLALVLLIGSLYDLPNGKIIYEFPKPITISLLERRGDWIKIRIQFDGILFIPKLDVTGWVNIEPKEKK